MKPIEVLRKTQTIEQELGRTAKSDPSCPNYQDRTIDIDIIRAFEDDGKEINMSDPLMMLTLPHPFWRERDFVRIPMEEIWNKTPVRE